MVEVHRIQKSIEIGRPLLIYKFLDSFRAAILEDVALNLKLI